MAKFNEVLKRVLFEEGFKNLQVFYDVDVFIQEFKDSKKPKETPAPTPPPGDAIPESTNLNEEIFSFKNAGSITLDKKGALNILTLNDLLAYIKNENSKGQIINELVVEIIRSLSGEDTESAAQDILNEGDKCNVIIDYGFSKDDSVGVQVSKNKGVKMASLVMRKDGNVFGSGKFVKNIFNNTITNVFLKELKGK
jgi:hypothetical protein